MIERKELAAISRKIGIHAEIIERDYMIGILVDAFRQVIPDDFAFHGGSCKNKAYNGFPGLYDNNEIETYFSTNRFSTDIDAWLNPKLATQDRVRDIMAQVSFVVKKDFGINIPISSIDIKENRGPTAHPLPIPRLDVRLPYLGPMTGGNTKFQPTKVKIAFGPNEGPVLQTTTQLIYHPYTDKGEKVLSARCFSYPELFANKLFALYNRHKAKDLYDLTSLAQKYDIKPYYADIQKVLEIKKERWKKVLPQQPKDLLEARQGAQAEWKTEMPSLIKSFGCFEDAWQQFESIFLEMQSIRQRQAKCLLHNHALER